MIGKVTNFRYAGLCPLSSYETANKLAFGCHAKEPALYLLAIFVMNSPESQLHYIIFRLLLNNFLQ